MSWTDGRIDQLKALWAQGRTARQIADAIGLVTRNAVIGKAHRLGLPPRPSPVHSSEEISKDSAEASPPRAGPLFAAASPPAEPDAPEVTALPRRAARPRKVERDAAPATTGSQKGPVAPAGPPAPPRRAVPAKPSAEVRDKTRLIDLTDKICRWPIGHPGEPDFHFCGEAVNSGFPYCRPHCAVAYQAPKPRRNSGKSPASFGGGWKR
jgi:GcrA cell cycle regulator